MCLYTSMVGFWWACYYAQVMKVSKTLVSLKGKDNVSLLPCQALTNSKVYKPVFTGPNMLAGL